MMSVEDEMQSVKDEMRKMLDALDVIDRSEALIRWVHDPDSGYFLTPSVKTRRVRNLLDRVRIASAHDEHDEVLRLLEEIRVTMETAA